MKGLDIMRGVKPCDHLKRHDMIFGRCFSMNNETMTRQQALEKKRANVRKRLLEYYAPEGKPTVSIQD